MSVGFTVQAVAPLKASVTESTDTVAEPRAPWRPWRLSRLWRGYVGRRSMLWISWELVAMLIAAAFILGMTVL